MKIWGIHKTYPGLSWWENFMGGHITIWRLTIFGANAMHWFAHWESDKYGYMCISLPSIERIKGKRPWFLYFSPNATPWASTYYVGGKKHEHTKARVRKNKFGHNFNSRVLHDDLMALNNKLDANL